MSEQRRRRLTRDSDGGELEPLLNLSVLEPWRSNVVPSGHCAGRRGPAGPPAAPRRATARTLLLRLERHLKSPSPSHSGKILCQFGITGRLTDWQTVTV